jgi:tRNA-dihydrouridine synthase B
MLSIGTQVLENWLIMAPMAGITNLPFRLMAKKLGAGLVFTEMISAEGLIRGQKRTLQYLRTHPLERPLAVQIFGARPEAMARAAEIVAEAGADIVDINMGCPVKKVVKTGAGGALLRDLQKAAAIVSAVRRTCPVPLTVKLRAGWSPHRPVACQLARMMEDCGVDALTIHPRAVTQGFSGHANWTIISKIKDQTKVPCIGNGDVFTPRRALEMRRRTRCDAVMIGRGAVGNPWIFKQILDLERGLPGLEPELTERKALILEHFGNLSGHMGELRAARTMRGLLIRYTKGLPRSNRFRNSISGIRDLDSLVSALDGYFSILEQRDS